MVYKKFGTDSSSEVSLRLQQHLLLTRVEMIIHLAYGKASVIPFYKVWLYGLG